MENNDYSPTKIAVFVTIIALSVWLKLHSLGELLSTDLSAYSYIAHRMLEGDLLYTDVWDHKPPAIFVVNMAAELVWGYDSSAVVFLGVVFAVIAIVFLFLFLKDLAGVNTALLGAALWALVSNSLALDANLPNTEAFINAFMFMALWSFGRYARGEQKGFLFLTGLFFALASTFKTTVFFPFAAVCLYMLLSMPKGYGRSRVKEAVARLVAMFVPGAVVWGGVFLYFALAGNFSDFWDAVFLYNSQYAGNIVGNVLSLFVEGKILAHIEILPLLMLSIIWILFSRKEYGPLGRSFFILFLAGCLVGMASPGKFYVYYYQLLLPVFCILSALSLRDMALSVRARSRVRQGSHLPRPTPYGLSVVLSVLLLAWFAYPQFNYMRMTPLEISQKKYGDLYINVKALSLRLQEMTAPCDSVFHWGTNASVYYYSRRKSVTGVTSMFFMNYLPPVEQARWLRRLRDDVRASPPAAFVWSGEVKAVEDNKVFGKFIMERYEYVERYDDLILYVLRDRGKPGRGIVTAGAC